MQSVHASVPSEFLAMLSSMSPAVVLGAIEPRLVRKATLRDIPALLRLINGYAAQGIMLPRTEFELSENIRDFTVVCAGQQLLGCGALHFYTPISGEIRSLAVAPSSKRGGIGRLLVEALEEEANHNNLHAIFAFTYVFDFFDKLGFQQVDRGLLPLKVWKDCMSCPKFDCCEEIAVVKTLTSDPLLSLSLASPTELVELPHPKHD
jgi:amino-acid N-acetyltransferase